jgi:hypothetical protein
VKKKQTGLVFKQPSRDRNKVLGTISDLSPILPTDDSWHFRVVAESSDESYT